MADRDDDSEFPTILPFQLRAIRARERAALDQRDRRPGTVRAGIRHIASGRMVVTHSRLFTVTAILTARAVNGRGLLKDDRLEAVLVDEQRQVFAGFWPSAGP